MYNYKSKQRENNSQSESTRISA